MLAIAAAGLVCIGSGHAQSVGGAPTIVGAGPAATSDRERAADADAKLKAARALKQLAIDAETKPGARESSLLFKSDISKSEQDRTAVDSERASQTKPPLVAPLVAAAPTLGATPIQVPLPQAVPRFSPEQSQDASRYTARGSTLLLQGDIVQARNFLERAADLGSPAAALTLAQTFDDRAFKKWRIVGLVANKERAVYWYMKAQMLGSKEASEALASLSP